MTNGTPDSSLQPHRGVLILVLGIASAALSLPFFCCWPIEILTIVAGIIAWVLGNRDLRAMDAGLMDPAGRNQTKNGRLLGIIGVSLSALFLLVGVVLMILQVSTNFLGTKM